MSSGLFIKSSNVRSKICQPPANRSSTLLSFLFHRLNLRRFYVWSFLLISSSEYSNKDESMIHSNICLTQHISDVDHWRVSSSSIRRKVSSSGQKNVHRINKKSIDIWFHQTSTFGLLWRLFKASRKSLKGTLCWDYPIFYS